MNARIVTLERQMLSLIASIFDAFSVVLFLPESAESDAGEDTVYHLASFFSLGNNVVEGASIKAGQGLVGWIVAKKKPLEVPQFNQQGGNLLYYEGGEESHIKAFMGCPLPSGGALCVDTKRQFSFSEREQKHLQMFAAILDGVHAMDNFDSRIGDIPLFFDQLEVLDRLRLNYKRWDTFISGFLCSVAAATNFDYCAFSAVEVQGESYAITAENQPVLVRNNEPFYQSMAYGLAGWVFRNGQEVFQSGEDGKAPALFGNSENLPIFRAVVCLPVSVNKSTRACLCLGHTDAHPVGATMRTFLREAVGLLSMHLENLYLRNRLRSSMELAQVYRIGPRAHNPDTEPYQPVKTEQED